MASRLTICPDCKDSWADTFIKEADPNAWVQVSAASPTHSCAQSQQEASYTVPAALDSTIGTQEWTPPAPEYAAPRHGPCEPWITQDQFLTCCEEKFGDESEMDVAINLASELLYHATGKQFPGICERTIRPACVNCCTDVCSCSSNACDISSKVITLPAPAVGVRSVFINGVRLSDSSYVMANFSDLIRTDGECWPSCNDMTRSARVVPLPTVDPPTAQLWWEEALSRAGITCIDCTPGDPCRQHAPVIGECQHPDGYMEGVSPEFTEHVQSRSAVFDDSWEVTYYHGRPVPLGGQTAAATLACEVVKARCGDDSCRLPSNMSFLVRQDISVAFEPLEKLLADKRFGIYEVDLWVNSVNPSKLARRGSALDPQKVQRQAKIIH